MQPSPPTLHMLCGKIAAGKSTLAARLADKDGTVLIAEDAWLGTLFAGEMRDARDYLRCASRLRQIMGPHIAALLKSGVSVVLDFQANTVESRVWMRGILDATRAAHKLHVLAPPDDVCLARMHARNETGEHPFSVTDAQFHQFSKHFLPPSPDEGFDVIWYDE